MRAEGLPPEEQNGGRMSPSKEPTRILAFFHPASVECRGELYELIGRIG